jgi:hypothetical protein
MLRFVLSAGVAGVCAMAPLTARAWDGPAGSPPGWHPYWLETTAAVELFAHSDGDLTLGRVLPGMFVRMDAPEQNGRLWVYNPSVEGWAWLPRGFTRPAPEPSLEQVLATQDPRTYLYQQAPDLAPRLDCIITHESNWNPLGRNPRTHASGLAQFLPSTWATTPNGQLGQSPFEPFANIDAAIWLARTRGWTQWQVFTMGFCH